MSTKRRTTEIAQIEVRDRFTCRLIRISIRSYEVEVKNGDAYSLGAMARNQMDPEETFADTKFCVYRQALQDDTGVWGKWALWKDDTHGDVGHWMSYLQRKVGRDPLQIR